MSRKYFFILSIISVLFLTMAAISAQDNDTEITVLENEISVPVSVSEVEIPELKADESQDGGDVPSGGDSKNATPSGNASGDVDIVKNSFTDLQNKVNSAGSVLYLSGTYKYNPAVDSGLVNGIYISKTLKIVGVGSCTIDGAGMARCLKVAQSCKLTLENVVVKNGYVRDGNGAGVLLSKNAKLKIVNCVFKYNTVYNGNGGAISVAEGGKVVIKSSKFYYNKAIRESDLPWESFKKGMGGAIISRLGSVVKIYSSKFKYNEAFVGIVLVISETNGVKQTSDLRINHCVFSKNHSDRDGVIYLDEFGTGKIYNSKFYKNTSPNGAGIVKLDTSVSVTVKNCKFTKNSVHSGGGIFINTISSSYLSNVKISKCTFTKNYAKYYGGAIFSVYGSVKATKCVFYKNKASKYGGALYGKYGVYKAYKCTYTKNKAPHGAKVEFVKVKTNIKKGKDVYFS